MHDPALRNAATDPASALALEKVTEFGRATQLALRPDDPRFAGTVRLACRDGTNLLLPHAFTVEAGDWIYVHTRDHGYFIEHKDSVATCNDGGKHDKQGRAA